MKDHVIQSAHAGKTALEKMNLVRNELQHLILQEMDRLRAFERIAFLGGTALRIVFGLDRFSEDLDFSSSLKTGKKADCASLFASIGANLKAYGFDCDISRVSTVRAVHSCFVNFSGILQQVGKMFPRGQKLAIKLDIDTNPPRGAHETVTAVAGARLYKVRHYDLPSLFAGKLHALLYRQYTKGRDLYDFLWYTTRKVRPNLKLLENTIRQSQGKAPKLNFARLADTVAEKMTSLDFTLVQRDIEPFLFNRDTVTLFEKEIFLNAAESLRGMYPSGSGLDIGFR